MVKSIKFDEQNYLWMNDYMFNKALIDSRITYIYEVLRNRGYIYLNTIYETFGAGWNPYDHNDCLMTGPDEVVISYKHTSDADFEINILY